MYCLRKSYLGTCSSRTHLSRYDYNLISESQVNRLLFVFARQNHGDRIAVNRTDYISALSHIFAGAIISHSKMRITAFYNH